MNSCGFQRSLTAWAASLNSIAELEKTAQITKNSWFFLTNSYPNWVISKTRQSLIKKVTMDFHKHEHGVCVMAFSTIWSTTAGMLFGILGTLSLLAQFYVG